MDDTQQRKRTSIGGGLIVVLVGVIFLIANFQPQLDMWSIAMRYWPVFLILIGLGKIFDAFLMRNDGVPRGATGNAGTALVMLVLLGFLVFALQRGHSHANTRQDAQTIALQGAKSVVADIDLPTGTLDLSGGAPQLLDANFRYRERDGKPEAVYSVSGDRGTLDISQNNDSHTHLASSGNDWRLLLGNAVPLDLTVSIGAGKANLNFQGLDISHADVKIGAGELNLDLTGPRKSDLHVDIHGGVGKAVIRLPRDVGSHLQTSGALGSVNAEGFHEADDVYTNDAFGKSASTVYVTVSGGVGQVTLVQQ